MDEKNHRERSVGSSSGSGAGELHPWRPVCEQLRAFFAITYIALLALCVPFLAGVLGGALRTSLYGLEMWLTYGFIYLLPALLLTWGLIAALGWRGRRPTTWRLLAVRGAAVAMTAATAAFLFVDGSIHHIFGYHVNGFVLNLVTTRGGVESMGAGPSTYRTCALLGIGIVVFQGAVLWIAGILSGRFGALHRRLRYGWALLILLALSIGERVTYGVAHVQADLPTLAAADAFPLYSCLTFDHLAEDLGFEVHRRSGIRVDADDLQLRYPKDPMHLVPPENPPNIVWLVAESFRGDALDPEIMPATWEFSRDAIRFERHYSGGNCTRMGVFSMFYGLYGTYWFAALDERCGPVLIDALVRQNYQFSINTSARLTYPEFDSTVFVDLPPGLLHEWSGGETWERDREHVDALLSFLDGRDRSRPFMIFSFFESPHARYQFPKEAIIREPYLEDLNYASMSLDRDIELIRNRYLNSCHYLDMQIARLLDYLGREELLDETIIVITGDHGEEFGEKGRWGHGSTFVEEQIRVPLVLRVPGEEARVVRRMTCHLDLPATILPRVGVVNPPAELSEGMDLLEGPPRDCAVVADWSRICLVTGEIKASFPYRAEGGFRMETTDPNDAPLPAGVEGALPVEVMSEVLAGLGNFRRH